MDEADDRWMKKMNMTDETLTGSADKQLSGLANEN